MPEPEEDPILTHLCDGDPLAVALAKLRPTSAPLLQPEFFVAAGVAKQSRKTTFWRRVALAQVAAMFAVVGLWGYSWPGSEPTIVIPQAQPMAMPARPSRIPQVEMAPAPRELGGPSTYPTRPLDWDHLTNSEPSIEERARWAVIRRGILLGGLSTVPEYGNRYAPTPDRWQSDFGSIRGVYAAPIRPDAPPHSPDPEE